MTGELKIDTQMLTDKAIQLAEAAAALEKDLEAMRENMGGLIGSWEGADADAFSNRFLQDYEAMKTMCKMINDLQKSMSHAAGEYVKCEQSIQEAVDSIKI